MKIKLLTLYSVLFAVLLGLAFGLFYPSTDFSLVGFDDSVFIVDNPIIFNGFSWGAVKNAFTELHGDKCMYVPLLWVSYLFDLKCFGAAPANPWGFHFTNVLLHALNAGLFFAILYSITRKPWRAFFFAAFWAFHPFRVESVAWVTERKDVLSGFFAFLCVWLYLLSRMRSAAGGAWSTRLLSWGAFAVFVLGLLAKPMLVTLPFVLLLLDTWPLGHAGWTWDSLWKNGPRLVLEKIHYFTASSIATAAMWITQEGAKSPLPLLTRLWMIPSNYWFYVKKTMLPMGLHPMVFLPAVTRLSFLLSFLVLVGITAWVWARRRTNPNEWVGWLIFGGLLVPVIGLVPLGVHQVADRYSYLPATGMSLALLFMWPTGSASMARRVLRGCVAASLLTTLCVLTFAQLPTWKDDSHFYAHILRHHPGHYFAKVHVAEELFFKKGDLEKANELADELMQSNPTISFSILLKASCLSQLDNAETAWEFARQHPASDNLTTPGAYSTQLAALALLAERFEDAERHMAEALAMSVSEPKSLEQIRSIAMLLAKRQGREPLTLRHAAHIAALQGKTELTDADYTVSYTTLWHYGYRKQALEELLRLTAAYPNRVDLLNNVAWLLATTEASPAKPEVAIRLARKALESAPEHPLILDTLAVAQANAGDFDAAIRTTERLLMLLRFSTALDAPGALKNAQERMALYREGKPYREASSARLLHAL